MKLFIMIMQDQGLVLQQTFLLVVVLAIAEQMDVIVIQYADRIMIAVKM